MNSSPLGNKIDPDNIYVNVRINHDNSTTDISRATYDVTKNIPIVLRPEDYYLAVVDFTIPFTTIPLTIAKIRFNDPAYPNNVNIMDAAIVINAPGLSVTVPLIYIPSSNLPPVYQTDPRRQIITAYHYIYSYTALLNMFNVALLTAWNDQVNFQPPDTMGPEPPYFLLDPDSQLISLIVNDAIVTDPEIRIGINDAALNYLQAFNFFYQQGAPPGLQTDIFFFNFYQQGNVCNLYGQYLDIFDPDVNVTDYYWKYTQEYQALDLWSDLRKIFITTDNIPIRAEEKAVNLPNGTQTGQVAYIPVLFDYTPPFNNSASSRTLSYYVPQSQYRLVDVLGTEPITKVSVAIYWQDTLGDAYPLYIQIYQAINIKLGFFKKSLYKHYFPVQNQISNR